MSSVPQKKPISLVMFDLDGTLIDSVPDLAIAVDQTLEALSLPAAGEDNVRSWVGNGAAKLIERALRFAGLDVAAETFSGGQAKALAVFFECYQRCCAEKTVLYPGVEALLETLRQHQVKMAIVTNKPRQFVSPILKHLSIESYFDYILGGDDLPNKKPHPEPLLHCMAELGVSADESLMVGDSRNDIQAARNANVLVAAVDYGYNHGAPIEDEQPDFVLSNIHQVIARLKNVSEFMAK